MWVPSTCDCAGSVKSPHGNFPCGLFFLPDCNFQPLMSFRPLWYSPDIRIHLSIFPERVNKFKNSIFRWWAQSFHLQRLEADTPFPAVYKSSLYGASASAITGSILGLTKNDPPFPGKIPRKQGICILLMRIERFQTGNCRALHKTLCGPEALHAFPARQCRRYSWQESNLRLG